ncbi:MAG TPA: serine/threonine-protein kinase [Candidatus Limnocylindria bacterium]|nr:serine/threonine-protein kinase [Candidatus Limnocylindria bacterium]
MNSPYWSGGVCLRCASARLLGGDSCGSGDTISSSTPRTTPATEHDPLPERLGPYEILEELGRGGMGRVYAARQVGLGRIVALKVMGDASRNADFELRFLREAQTAARLRHPNLVAVHDFGRTDGQLYFSMDYIEGGDLARRLRGRPFAPWEAASLLRKVTLALAHAHAEGVLHRDLKPSNILLDGDEPKLADFGLATQLEAGGDLTAVTGVLGTPHYLAPEALRQGSAALSVASDIYALGVVLFELLTGRTPFAGATPGALVALVENSEPPSPRLLAPAVPRDLETIVLKCLERDPARRYGSAVALAEDLRRFLDGEPIIARPLSPPDRFLRWCRRRPALAAVWVLVTTLAIGSTLAVGLIQQALHRTQMAEAESRERLRAARLAEARAVRRTTQPGRRVEALAALTEAARIRPGADIQTEAAAALQLFDMHAVEHWSVAPGVPGEVSIDRTGQLAGFEPRDSTGSERGPVSFRRWGQTNSFGQMTAPGTNAVGPLHLSADGSLAMQRFLDDTLRVWRVGENQPFLTLRDRPAPGGTDHTEPFNDDYDFSPDGSLVALGLPGHGISLHRVKDGAEVARWAGGDTNSRVRFSPTGRQLAATRTTDFSVREAYVLDLPDLAVRHRLPLGNSPNSLSWSSDGQVLAVSLADNSIEAFDLQNGRLLNRFNSPTRDPSEITFLGHDSLVAMRGRGTTLHLVSYALGREELVVEGFGPSPVAVAPDSLSFITTSVASVATRWRLDLPAGLRILPPPAPSGYEQAFNNCCLDFSPDGRWAISGHGRYTVLRDLVTGHTLAEFDDSGARGIINTTTAFADNGQSVIRGSNRSGLWRHPIRHDAAGQLSLGPPELLDPETRLIMTDHSPDGRRFVFVSPWMEMVKVVEVTPDGMRPLGRWSVPGAYSAALSPSGKEVLVNCCGTDPHLALQRLRVYRVTDGSVVKELPAQAFGEAVWSSEGHTAMTSNNQDQSILWDTATWTPRATLTGALGGNISTFILNADGTQAIVARDEHVHLVSCTNGAEIGLFESPQSAGLASAVRFLPGGHGLGILWRDGRIDLFDPAALRKELSALGLDWPAGGR